MSFLSSGPMGLAVQMLSGRWFMAFASFLIMSAAGATYIFAIYSADIKSSLGYNQQTLNTLSFFKDLGANVGIHAGLLAEVTPTWLILAVGSATNLFGYLMVYLSITGRTPRPHVWQMCLYICVGANSQSFANTGALVTCVKNFPESRGIVLGLLKGFVGLSGAVFTQLYLAFYGGRDSKSLVLLIAWLPAAISAVFLRTIRIIPPNRLSNEFKVFCNFLYVSLALAAYLMVVIILQKKFAFTRAEYAGSAAVVLFLLFILPLAVIFKSPNRGEDYSILQALVSVDMFLLFVSTVFGVGGTLTAIDNMGQIGESLGYPAKSIATFVSLISIWNYTGRVASGFASEILLAKYKLPRPLMFAFVLLVSCLGHLLVAFGVPGSLYAASIIIGFCFGAAMPLILSIISELFGLKYYSTLYNFGGMASPVGSYILNVRVAGYLYDREAMKQNGHKLVPSSSGKSLTCIGVQCFKRSFLIITAVTLAGALVMLLLAWRTKDFYRGDIYARFREGLEGESKAEETKSCVEKEKLDEKESLKGIDSIQTSQRNVF